MRIQSIETFTGHLNFIPDVAPHMLRATTHHTGIALTRVTLENGAVGWGDGPVAWGDTGSVDTSWEGRCALLALRECRDSRVQMACYDAVGRALGVPAHVLMGPQVRPRVPFAYWTIDLPPDTLARQVVHAASLGYKVYKFKCRSWWDPIEQMEAASRVAPPGFQLWLDFNSHLREARIALPILKELSRFDCVGGIESPIPQRDLEGYRVLRSKIDRPIAIHYGGGACHVVSEPGWDPGAPGHVQIPAEIADGFVLGGDVDRVRQLAGCLHEFRKPFWIQTVGTALRAGWVAHLASTCWQAQWSSLSAHDLWAADVAPRPEVVDGWMPVPKGPGLGVEVDEAAVERFRNEPPPPAPRRISTVVYPSGVRWHFSHEQQRHEAFYFGQLPPCTRGIRLEVREDDGSADFDGLWKRCDAAPVVTG